MAQQWIGAHFPSLPATTIPTPIWEFSAIHTANNVYFHITLGPACNEFAYYDNWATMNGFFPQKRTFLIDTDAEKFHTSYT